MEEKILTLFSPIMQAGFAGIAFLMIAIVVWLIRNLLAVLKSNGSVIERNTGAIINVGRLTNIAVDSIADLERALLTKPCLFEEAQKREEDRKKIEEEYRREKP